MVNDMTKLSELINDLQIIKKKFGDLPLITRATLGEEVTHFDLSVFVVTNPHDNVTTQMCLLDVTFNAPFVKDPRNR